MALRFSPAAGAGSLSLSSFIRGPQGAAATIEVGTVTTLAAGQPATVTNTGTSGAAVFDFDIPQGATGPTDVHGTPVANQFATFFGAATIQGVAITGLVKGNGASAPAAAVAGTDYLAPPAGSAITKANSGAALAAAVEGTDYWKPGGTDVAVADGGTGASTAAAALSNLSARGQGKETIWIPATSMISATTNGPSTGTVEQSTNKNMTVTKDFDQTTSEIVQFDIAFPKSWNLGTVTFIPYWTAASGSGTAIWALSGVAISDDDPLDVAFGTAQSSTDTLITAYDNHVGPESSAITIAGTPAVGDLVNFKLVRDIADTLSADAKLIGIKLFFTTSAVTDA